MAMFPIADVRNELTEPQTGLHWYVSFSEMDTIDFANGKTNSNASIDSNLFKTGLVMRCSNVGNLPVPQNNHIQVQLHGHTINYVGKTTRNGSVSFTIVEGIDQKATQFLDLYNEAYWTQKEGQQQYTRKIKVAQVQVFVCDPNDNIVRTYSLDGCLCKFSSNLSLSQDAGIETIDTTVDFDTFKLDFKPTILS